MGRRTGRQHHRVHHPDAFALTADVAGPLSPSLDPTSKGTMGKNLRYLLVAKYLVPKAFVKDYAGKPPPDDHGVPRPDMTMTSSESWPWVRTYQLSPGKSPAEVEVVPGDYVEDVADCEPSEAEPDEAAEQDAECSPGDEIDMVMRGGDCEPPEMTYLMFGTALANNQSSTVREALQNVVLYLQMHGLPVYRFHSDKGEFYNHQFRGWLRDQGVYGTWSEPSVLEAMDMQNHQCDGLRIVQGHSFELQDCQFVCGL